jgi:DNA-binding NtrC family response regulator
VRAARAVAEARALGDAVPVPVRADLHLLDAELALLSGAHAKVARALAELEPELRMRDALVDARALALEAEVELGQGRRKRAVGTSLRAVRRARSAQISHLEGRAWGIFREARMKGPPRSLVAWLDTTAGSASRETSERALLSALVTSTGAERAFLVEVDPRPGTPLRVIGLDSEGLALGEPERRVDTTELRALASGASRVLRTNAGDGSRILAVRPGERTTTVLVVEHRFAKGRFDDLVDSDMLAYVSAAAIAGHLAAAPERTTAHETREPAWAAHAPLATPQKAAERAERGAASDEETTYFPGTSSSVAFPQIVGKSLALERAKARLAVAAKSDLPVLLTGETGTGKEVFAQALHLASTRAKGPFVALNCGAIPENLFESELFGHARGAYTGAERARAGLLATAEKGTLFLDEIGELPPPRQAALLRILETRRYRPVGGDEERAFDVRIVAATNRDLDVEVEKERFRRDLLYRLDVLKIEIPPLRERREDIGLLVDHFLRRAGKPLDVAKDARAALEAHGWPGNVRELEHEIARLLALGVPRVGRSSLTRRTREGAASAGTIATEIRASIPEKDTERKALEAALASQQGNLTHTAKALGLTRQGLKKRMVRLGLRPPKEEEP